MIRKTVLALLCAAAVAQAQKTPALLVSVKNPLAEPRPNETVALRISEIAALLPSPVPERLVLIDRATGIQLLTQVAPDELLFQSDLAPGETRQFRLIQAPGPVNAGQSLVDARFVLPREDFAWENDRIAFRMYGPAMAKDVANGIDVWTKRVRARIVEKWYRGEEAAGSAKLSYHVDRGEGADFFSVGRTLGAGGSGLWHQGVLHQPGVFTTYRIVANGPIRVIFELFYDTLRVGPALARETRRITLDAGWNFNRVDVLYVTDAPGEELRFAAGLAKRKNALLLSDERGGWISLWGPVGEDSANGSLGTGIIVPSASYAGSAQDSANHLILGRARSGQWCTYYAGAGWTGNGDFPAARAWQEAIAQAATRLRHPVTVTLTLQQ
ncbi:MAG: Pectinesterase [Bacteroidetes bacterium]|nr:Pectinesterase [Bacteroidota bacterium]